MCLPPQLPPPNQSLATQRSILQLTAASLLLLAFFAAVAGRGFDIFWMLILAAMLYCAWARFDYLQTLILFLFFTFETFMAYFRVIQVIQYYSHGVFDGPTILYIIAKVVFYPTAMFFVHGAYKHFKAFAVYNQNEVSIFGDYQMMPQGQQQPMQRPPPTHYAQSAQGGNSGGGGGGFQAFQGQGTVIG